MNGFLPAGSAAVLPVAEARGISPRLVMIRLDSPVPIFFKQKRVGFNGVEFYMLKFRSMYANSDDAVHREAIAKYMNGQKVSGTTESELAYKQINDPHVTKVGRFLRKTRIDSMVEMDSDYLKEPSHKEDLKLVALTVR